MAGGRHEAANDEVSGPGGNAKRLLIIAVLGVLVAVAGAVLAVHALTGNSASVPAGSTAIPPNVGTAAPTPAGTPTAAPLAASAPAVIQIPALGVSSPVARLGLNSDGSMQEPPLGKRDGAGWYDRSVAPGQRGTSIILGNFSPADSVFFTVTHLHPGDLISVLLADGTAALFAVDGIQKVAAPFPGEAIYINTSYPSLHVLTPDGRLDAATGQYPGCIVVYAHLVS